MKLATKIVEYNFPDDYTCLDWLKNQRYPDGIFCRVCQKVTKHHKLVKRDCYCCDRCGNQVFPKAGTIFHKSSLSLKTWFDVIARMTDNRRLSPTEIQRDYGVTYKTAWHMVQKVRGFLEEGNCLTTGLIPTYKILNNINHSEHLESNKEEKELGGSITRAKSIRPSKGSLIASGGSIKLMKIAPDPSERAIFVNKINKNKIDSKDIVYKAEKDRTARLLMLQIFLWQNPKGLKVSEIVHKTNTSKRTAYRDLSTLEHQLGVPVWQDKNKWGLADGYFLPPINFTLIEAFDIFILSRLLRKYSFTYNPTMIGILTKLNAIIPEPLKSKIQNSINYLENRVRDETQFVNLIKVVQAWLSRHCVKICYQDDEFGAEQKDLIIDPYFFEPVYTGRSVFVIAYAHLKKSICSFNMNRIIGDVEICKETYNIPSDFDADEFIYSAWDRYSDAEIMNIKLRFMPKISKTVMRTIWHPSQKLEIKNDGSIIVTYQVRDSIEFRSWILGWGSEVEVLEPKTFRDEITNIIKALSEIYLSYINCESFTRSPSGRRYKPV
jgi:predicted DNA-binding transcriptional regulator YafY